MSSNKDRSTIWQEWRELVNLPPADIESWLETDESQSVGADSGDGESIGHKSGQQIIEIKRTNKDDLSDEQWDHMATVVGYIKRHLSQGGPKNNVKSSDWRYSLMNWGHDPLKSDK